MSETPENSTPEASFDAASIDDLLEMPAGMATGGQDLAAGLQLSTTKVQILLAVWGRAFIDQFAEISLPTLLAPGNLPALAAGYPVEFVFLTSRHDLEYLDEQPAIRALGAVCQIRMMPIDDLIVSGNYSTTLTLAFGRAIRATGEEMLNTYFIFLVSDYIMADGSMRGLMKHMQAGRSGVLAGNFQIVHEATADYFRTAVDPETHVLAIPPRRLMRYALRRLHAATVANIVNQPMSHNSHANRLFWQIDENTLIGRFFLMHMLCIKPETTQFKIGASCDYSFIPEMCPSGNIGILDDSDEYLVVELQGAGHEGDFLRPGPFDPDQLATGLSEWTTARHRENAATSVYFHALDIPDDARKFDVEAENFVETIRRKMSRKAKPHRAHPYWIGAVSAFRGELSRRHSDDDRELLMTEDLQFARGTLLHGLRIAFWRVFGKAPNVHFWHHSWQDYHALAVGLKRDLGDAGHRMLVLSELPNAFSEWLAGFEEQVFSVQSTRFLRRPADRYAEQSGHFDSCFIYLSEDELSRVGDLLERIRPLMKPGSQLRIFIPNQADIWAVRNFSGAVASSAHEFSGKGYAVTDCRYRSSQIRRISRSFLNFLHKRIVANPLVNLPLVLVLMPVVFALAIADNLFGMDRNFSVGGYCSSVTLELTLL